MRNLKVPLPVTATVQKWVTASAHCVTGAKTATPRRDTLAAGPVISLRGLHSCLARPPAQTPHIRTPDELPGPASAGLAHFPTQSTTPQRQCAHTISPHTLVHTPCTA